MCVCLCVSLVCLCFCTCASGRLRRTSLAQWSKQFCWSCACARGFVGVPPLKSVLRDHPQATLVSGNRKLCLSYPERKLPLKHHKLAGGKPRERARLLRLKTSESIVAPGIAPTFQGSACRWSLAFRVIFFALDGEIAGSFKSYSEALALRVDVTWRPHPTISLIFCWKLPSRVLD